MITGKNNSKIKYVSQLQKSAQARADSGLFVVEGVRLTREVPAGLLSEVFVSEGFSQKTSDFTEIAAVCEKAGISCETVTDDIFAKMSDTKNPQGILATVRQPAWSFDDITASGGAVLVLEEIQDPGNLGTILRSSEAAGLSGIIMAGCADIFNPKVVRSTMGSIFRVPFCFTDNIEKTIALLHGRGYSVYAAHLGGTDLYESDIQKKAAFLIGNEGRGLKDATSAAADRLIKIPMSGQVESLNASIAATLLAYEWRRRNL